MTISIKLYAVLRELSGVDTFDIDIHDGATGEDVLEAVRKKYPVLSGYVKYVRLASPERYLNTHAVVDASITPELYVIPPVSGG